MKLPHVPNYVMNILKRSTFCYGKNAEVGYTFMIYKETAYKRVDTLKRECEKIVAWANRQSPECAVVNSCPTKTRYDSQCGVVTIYDPVMMYIENYIRQY